MSADAGNAFKHAGSPNAHARREAVPDPSKVAAKGIKTREAINWLALEAPDHPEPACEIDDEVLRRDAAEQSIQARKEMVNRMRNELRERTEKSRADFETARSWRDNDRER